MDEFPGYSSDRRCHVPGCTYTSRHGKPYCIEHLQFLPYPQRLEERERMRALELKKPPRIDGFVAEDLLSYVLQTPATYARLARDLHVPQSYVEKLVRLLAAADKVRLVPARRAVFVWPAEPILTGSSSDSGESLE